MQKKIDQPFIFSSQPLPVTTTIIEGFKLLGHTIWKTWYWAFLFQAISSLPALIQGLEGPAATKNIASFFLYFLLYLAFVAIHAFSFAFLLHRIYNAVASPNSTVLDSVQIFKERWKPIVLVSMGTMVLTTLGGSLLMLSLNRFGTIPGLMVLGLMIYVAIIILFYCPLILFDNELAVESLEKSYLLVRNHWWETFLAMLPAGVIGLILLLFAFSLQKPSLMGTILSMIVISSIVILLVYSLILVQFNNLKLLQNQQGLGSRDV